MIRIYPSEDGFEILFQLATDIAIWTNPHLFFNLKDVPELERKVELEKLKTKMGEIIS